MADVSKIKLPNGTTYDLKDVKAYRKGADIRHRNTSIDQDPQYVSLFENKMTGEYFQTIRTIAGVGDYFYALHMNPDYTIQCNYSGKNGTKGNFAISTLFRPSASSTVLLDVDSIAETPFILTINRKSGNITATDVVNLELYTHTLGQTKARLTDYKVELYTTGSSSPSGTYTWQTVYERHNVSDSPSGLIIALNPTTYSHLYFSGVRFTILGATPGSTNENAWNYNCLDLSLFRLTDQRPIFSAARAIGALDISGGDVYGVTNFKSNVNITGSLTGSGASLTNLNGSNISSGTVPAARLPVATTSTAGAMSAADKTKLNGIAENATANEGTITGITMNGASKGTSGNVDLGTVLTEHQDISGKANLDSPQFTGTPTSPTPTSESDDQQIATTAFVKAAISAGVTTTEATISVSNTTLVIG